eukprot:6188744-Amphidinium_carterae.1
MQAGRECRSSAAEPTVCRRDVGDGAEPVHPPTSQCEQIILCNLALSCKTGERRRTETAVSLLASASTPWLSSGLAPQRVQNHEPNSNYGPYSTPDNSTHAPNNVPDSFIRPYTNRQTGSANHRTAIAVGQRSIAKDPERKPHFSG